VFTFFSNVSADNFRIFEAGAKPSGLTLVSPAGSGSNLCYANKEDSVLIGHPNAGEGERTSPAMSAPVRSDGGGVDGKTREAETKWAEFQVEPGGPETWPPSPRPSIAASPHLGDSRLLF